MATHFLNLPLATTLLLLLLLFLSPTSTTGVTDTDLVLDINGNPLEVGSEYYIYSVIPMPKEKGGFRNFSVLSRSPKPDKSPCPLYVVETPLMGPQSSATPVKFIIPANETQTHVSLSSSVFIDSGYSASCRDYGFWRVRKNHKNGYSEVLAAGYNVSSMPPLFSIKPFGIFTVYKIAVNYPAANNYLGSYNDPNSRLQVGYLIDSEDAFPVVFIKKSGALAYMQSY